jgi:hypothetical protein
MCPLLPDGSAVDASGITNSLFESDRGMPIMLGVIFKVFASDGSKNRSANGSNVSRGNHHTCTVYASTNYGQLNSVFENVIIPPRLHSGIDNYEEDLPRGSTGLIDGSSLPADIVDLDPVMLNGEWCTIGFIGGYIERPFLLNYWPHPVDIYNLATSGNGNGQTTLKQFDDITGRSRKMWRNNGSLFLLNKEGSLYLDTSQANRTVFVSEEGLPSSILYPGGGHIQVDVKPNAQTEINWNDKYVGGKVGGPQIGAGSSAALSIQGETLGSNKPVFDPDLPHPDQPFESQTPSVAPRGTDRTYIQGHEYDVLVKTSKLALVGKAGGSYSGEIDLLVDALIKLKSGGDITATAGSNIYADAGMDIGITAKNDVDIKAIGDVRVSGVIADFSSFELTNIKSVTEVDVEAPEVIVTSDTILLGSKSTTDPVVLFPAFVLLMDDLIAAINGITIDTDTGPRPVTAAAQAVILEAVSTLSNLMSKKVKAE